MCGARLTGRLSLVAAAAVTCHNMPQSIFGLRLKRDKFVAKCTSALHYTLEHLHGIHVLLRILKGLPREYYALLQDPLRRMPPAACRIS